MLPISRTDWGAKTPRWTSRLNRPVNNVFIHHGAVELKDHSQEGEAATLRAYQRHHVETRRWSDIAYSFAVGVESGRVYELRGWDNRGGATRNHNKDSYAICLIGDTTKQQISQAAIDAIRELIAHGISSNKISAPTFQIRGHRDVKATSCPGESAYAVLYQMYPGQGESPDEPAVIPVLKPPPYVKALRLRRPRMRGYAVKWVQAAVGATPIDGIFGPGTKKKVVAWQRANGLVADGVAGRRSWKVMFGAG